LQTFDIVLAVLTIAFVPLQLGTVMFSYPIFMNMDQELRNELLLYLRPWMLLDQEYLFDALDVGREAYILTSGTFEVYRYENQFGHMAKDEDMITTVGELIGVIGLMDDGPPYRLTTVISYGRSEVLELTKEAFDHCCKLNYPDVYQSVQDMATSELTAPGDFLHSYMTWRYMT
jgi:CRP-like cAMP-binding protein